MSLYDRADYRTSLLVWLPLAKKAMQTHKIMWVKSMKRARRRPDYSNIVLV